jgi:hypothetical protein
MADTPEGLRFTERVAWVGFLLFFVVILAIYIARGIGLERDVTAANQALLEAQIRLSQYTRGEVPRPPSVGLTNAQRHELQRRGVARPEEQFRLSLERNTHLIPHEPVHGGSWHFPPDDIHILSDRWVLAHFEDGHLRGSLLLEYEAVHGNILWQVVDSFLPE